MGTKAIQVVALILATIAVAFVSFSAGAAAEAGAIGLVDGGSGERAGHDGRHGGARFLDQLHGMAFRLHRHMGARDHHGGGGFWHEIGDVVERLDLTDEQTARLESIHRAFETDGRDSRASMEMLHDRLVAQFEEGHVETDGVHDMIDAHLDEVRATAYAVMDDLFALLNSLDDEQREIVLAHLSGDRESHAGHGQHGGHRP